MRLGKLLCTASVLLMSANVFADSPRPYFGISISDAQFAAENGAKNDYTDLKFKLGYEINHHFYNEFHIGTNVSTDSDEMSEVTYIAGLIRGNLPLKNINIYWLLGLGGVFADTPTFDDSYADVAAGFGVELFGTDTTALSLEYMQYGIDDAYKTLGVGIVHHFNWPKLYYKDYDSEK